MNRRNFLKIGSLGATALSLEMQFGGLIPIFGVRGKNNSLFSKRLRESIPSICNLCPAKCGVNGFLDYEWLAAIRGNPQHSNNRGKICARGVAGINQVYDPERILKPLMRKGKRGEGKWEEISWSKVYSIMADRLIEIYKTGRYDQFVFHADEHNIRGLVQPFLKTFRRPTIMPANVYSNSNKIRAHQYTWGEENSVADAANSQYFLNFGGNPFEAHPQAINFTQRLVDARVHNRARLVTFDPRLSNTAGKSDEWIPIKPGTDAIVALAMANIIMKNNLHDAEFVNNRCNVSAEELRAYLSRFSAERAAQVSGVDSGVIKKIAKEFASNQPGIAISGGGMTEHENGVENERCVLLLNALVGNIDSKGGLCRPRNYSLRDHNPLNVDEFYSRPFEFFNLVNSGKKKVDFYFVHQSNPAYEYPDCSFTETVLKDESVMPFNVVMDTMMSETAALADIVLPATTCMESWDIDSSSSQDLIPFVSLARPVIKACGESKSLNDVFSSLSKLIGGNFRRSLNFLTMEGYYKNIATRIPGLTRREGFEQLVKNGFWNRPEAFPEYIRYRNRSFNTASGLIEVAASRSARRKGLSSLPDFKPLADHITLESNELILIPYSVNVMPADLGNAKWLSEIKHSNHAMVNPKTARRLKIKDGEKIQLETATGKLTVSIHISQGVHPDIIAISKGTGHWEYGRIAKGEKFESADPDTSLLWWHMKGKGVHPNFLISDRADPVGKGAAWMDTKVKIQKV